MVTNGDLRQNLLLADLLGYGMFLQRTYRQGYALDARNSAITKVRTAPDLVVILLDDDASSRVRYLNGAPGGPSIARRSPREPTSAIS